MVNIKALALSANQKPGGYDASFYYTPEAKIQNAQLIVSQVGEDTNWKMCVDAIVNGRTEAKVGAKDTSEQCICNLLTYAIREGVRLS